MEGKRILLVDDDIANTQGLEQRLKLENFVVERATNAYEAWDRLKQRKYDGIVMDIMLPSKNLFKYSQTGQDTQTGILLCRKIREVYEKSIKIVGVTNLPGQQDKFIRAGGDACIMKSESEAGNALVKALSK